MNAESKVPHATPIGPALPRPALLLVDDEPAILTALRVVFRKGYRLVWTTDGEEALQILATERIDVIVCDQRMPRITGVELLARARSVSPATVRILLTGYADNDAVMGAINDGEVHRFFQKPWDNHALRLAVEDAVALAGRLRRAEGARVAQARTEPAPPDASRDEASPDGPPQGLPQGSQTALIVPFPHAARPRGDGIDIDLESLPPAEATARQAEHVLVIDRQQTLYRDLTTAAKAELQFAHAPDIPGGLDAMTRLPVKVIVFSLHSDSEFERSFLKLLKSEHPAIIVIAVCDAADSAHMIDLINHARIFRFLRHPVSAALLWRHVRSAVAVARRLHEAPELTAEQAVPTPADAGSASAPAGDTPDLKPYFARLDIAIRSRLARWLAPPSD